MIIEYVGLANRWVGPWPVHEVHAWWHTNHDSHAKVKRAALAALRTDGKILDHAEVIGMDIDTYNTPHLSATVRIRTGHPYRSELQARHYTTCEECGGPDPSELVRMRESGAERALCYTCWKPLADTHSCKVLHWINRHGKITDT